MKKYHLLILIALLLESSAAFGQIRIKRKAEDKANQVIDDFLFGKKKKKKNEQTTAPSAPTTPSIPSGDSGSGTDDNYTPQPVEWGSLDFGKSIHFNTLINMLPETVNGFVRSEKPEGAMYNTQGFTYSTGIKTYRKDGRELQISLSDYLGAEYLVGAQTQQYEYESTDGFVKSFQGQGMTGWVSMEYDGNEGSLIATKAGRYLLSINTDGTSEAELKSIFNQINLSQLPDQ